MPASAPGVLAPVKVVVLQLPQLAGEHVVPGGRRRRRRLGRVQRLEQRVLHHIPQPPRAAVGRGAAAPGAQPVLVAPRLPAAAAGRRGGERRWWAAGSSSVASEWCDLAHAGCLQAVLPTHGAATYPPRATISLRPGGPGSGGERQRRRGSGAHLRTRAAGAICGCACVPDTRPSPASSIATGAASVLARQCLARLCGPC